ncbi:MAG TPA: nitroreductase family protein [Candidatus Dormibacteraeota bacterium]|nr:nitroreductase family protein [Candidatus Dormibacteraeota bacterium]
MQKPAATQHPVHDLIRERWSPRAFSEKAVSPEILRSLFEAARWAPSSNNEQPWAFVVGIRGEGDTFRRILGTLVEVNQTWARHAPVLAIAVSELAFARSGHSNRNAFYDTGAAVSQLTSEATSRGLFVHQMAGFDPHKAIEAFSIPNGWEPIAVMAIGYAGDPQTLPDALRERELAPGTRKALHEFVMSGQWGKAAPFTEK